MSIKKVKKICKVCGNPSYIWSRGRCQRCAALQDSKPLKIKGEEDLQNLIDDADIVFSKFIRQFFSIDGFCQCYTCRANMRWQELDCGHFVSRATLFLRWDERNAKPQCKNCNQFKNGNLTLYAARLEMEHPGLPELLMQEAKAVYSPSREEIKGIIADYSRRIDHLKNM